MRFSILHLSDLHRDLTDEIPNAWLIDSIIRDIDSLEEEQASAQKPSICVVSGDLIYGVKPSAANSELELKRQNKQALEFLIDLADRVFGGDRDRIVILPGNHDIAYKRVLESSTAVPPPTTKSEKENLVSEYFSENSQLRWSWPEMTFYRVVDLLSYKNRLSNFSELYHDFYQGRRSYSLDAESQYDLFDFPDLKLTILGLNSCYNNDPWQRAGRINSTALANACRKLRSPSRSGWLLAATWHHNLTGGPAQDDYLDPSFLQLLIDSGVSLGLHGHQHRSEWFDERYRLGPKPRKITIISAATLCAGPRNLSPGTPRGYNILELDSESWTGRLHQRQMVNLQFSMPVWGPGHFVNSNAPHVDFDLSPPLIARPSNLDTKLALEAADMHLGKREWTEALHALREHGADPMARRMRLKALQELNDPARIIEALMPPCENSEAVILGHTLLTHGTPSTRKTFLEYPFVANSVDGSVKEIIEKIRMRETR